MDGVLCPVGAWVGLSYGQAAVTGNGHSMQILRADRHLRQVSGPMRQGCVFRGFRS